MEFTITADEQKLLLSEARESITAELERRRPSFDKIQHTGILGEPCGAFVTLHSGSSLRGCIGRMTATSPLYETVRSMAREAAFGDPRFPPLKKDELELVKIEISALSPMSPCPDPRQVKVGVHGLLLRANGRSGVLLPQVPVEQRWNQDEYLDYICIKAGLPPGSYNLPGALFTFTAFVFGE